MQGQALKGVTPRTPTGDPYQAVGYGIYRGQRSELQVWVLPCFHDAEAVGEPECIKDGEMGKKQVQGHSEQHFTYVALP